MAAWAQITKVPNQQITAHQIIPGRWGRAVFLRFGFIAQPDK
jgi:hypothetical protein